MLPYRNLIKKNYKNFAMQLPTREIEMSYDYKKVVSFLIETAEKHLSKKFQIPKNEQGIIFAILAWFLEDELVAKEMNIDLKKGILLTGPIGCGKTTLLKLMQKIPTNRKNFGVYATRQIVSEFMQTGFETIEKYSSGNLYNETRQMRSICFDDLGAETTSKYFGNDCNVMAEILLTRYDLYKDKGLITHITTNLTAGEIESIYGNRLRSRMREMFNLFGYDEISKDKRK